MGAALVIVLVSIAIAGIIIITSSNKQLAPLLIVIGCIGLYMSLIQMNIKFFIIFLSFALAFIASGVIIMIANAKFKRA